MRREIVLKHFVRIVIWLICFNCLVTEMPVHHKKLFNFVVDRLDDGAYFYHSPTGKLNSSKGISAISHTFLVSSQKKYSQKINWFFFRTTFFGKISLDFVAQKNLVFKNHAISQTNLLI